MPSLPLNIVDLGQMRYADAYARQCAEVERLIALRAEGNPIPGTLFIVEHPPVITVSRRPDARRHIIAAPDELARRGVEVAETDRGGDITYHGPGQLVAYPILDLNLLNLGLHAYMRLLEDIVIETCDLFGVKAQREAGATGVWVPQPDAPPAKICAMGVRVRRWVSMHGVALNVTTNLEHFTLIVPCGLVGRTVTSLARELADACPPMPEVKRALSLIFARYTHAALEAAHTARAKNGPHSSLEPAADYASPDEGTTWEHMPITF